MNASKHALHECCAITGVGETRYSRDLPETSSLALQLSAAKLAAEDAGISPRDIDGIIAMAGAPASAEDFVTCFGIADLRFSGTAPLGGASCVAALQMAAMAIAAGVCRHVLLPIGRGADGAASIGSRIHKMPQFKVVGEFEAPSGAYAPAQLYAPMARRHMALYGTTSRQFAEIAVTTRAHALLNGNAVMTQPITVEDHQASRLISDPLRMLDCSLVTYGAAAVIVSARAVAPDMRSAPVWLMGVAEGHPDSPSSISQRVDITTLGLTKAAPKAFAMAGVERDDIDVCEIYDCFTYIALCQLEDLGFCKKGEGGPFVESGAIALGGRLPMNTHGGLLSQAHVSGMNHIVELVRQLRGEGGGAQVENARIGLVTGFGDLGDGSVAILRKDSA